MKPTDRSGEPGEKASDDSIEAELAAGLLALEQRDLLRTLGSQAGGERIDLVSNDTLGLSRHPDLLAAAAQAGREFGAGGRASRLLGGGCPLHARAERAAASWLGSEAAVLFNTGYMANLGLLGALVGRQDELFSDQLNHASIIDACRLARCRVTTYRHGDAAHLDELLSRPSRARRRLVVSETVFSMNGDLVALAELNEVCERHGASLILDEAHAIGLLGPAGAGAWRGLRPHAGDDRGADGAVLARVVTGGKALGVGGAFVAASRVVIDHLVNHCRPLIFTTALPPAVAGALLAAIRVVQESDQERQTCLELARSLALRLGLEPPAGAIVPLILGEESVTLKAAGACRDHGLDVRAVRPPTVPAGTSRLRIVLHAFNTARDLDQLMSALDGMHSPIAPTAPVASAATPLFVVGTDTGVGKTVVSALLLRLAGRKGPASYWKPVQTGDEDDTNCVAGLAGLEKDRLLEPAHQLPLPASPHEAAAAAGIEIDPERLHRLLRSHLEERQQGLLIVEPAGGLLVPFTLDTTLADWLAPIAPPLVLVARSGLGTLNHTLLTVEALRRRHLEPRALFLSGEPHPSNLRTLEQMTGIRRVIALPHLDPLDGAALDRFLLDHDLDGVLPG